MIKGDGKEYKLLAKWVDNLKPQDFYLTVEIGVREGYACRECIYMDEDDFFHEDNVSD